MTKRRVYDLTCIWPSGQRTELKVCGDEVICCVENSGFPRSHPISWRKVNKEKQPLLYDSAVKNRRKCSYHI